MKNWLIKTIRLQPTDATLKSLESQVRLTAGRNVKLTESLEAAQTTIAHLRRIEDAYRQVVSKLSQLELKGVPSDPRANNTQDKAKPYDQ